MKLPVLSSKTNLKGKRVLLRVDWNVPLSGSFAGEDSLKISRSVATVQMLLQRGAILLITTHLGRPKGRDPKLSTKQLVSVLKTHHGLDLSFLGEAIDTKPGLEAVRTKIAAAKPGTAFLLENVRFYAGEEKSDKSLAKAYASLADLFMNDAFASSHRAHVSVAGVASLLPHYAGPTLLEEVKALEPLIAKPKRPYLAFVGGAKISTKIGVITALLASADAVYVGGAMATAFFAAQKREIGRSYVEKEGIVMAKKLLKHPKLVLPVDVVVAKKLDVGAAARSATTKDVKKAEMIGDIGPETMRTWAADVKKAKTIVWNGPMGVSEIPTFAHGSLVLARAIAARSKGDAYGVVGGGDTLPIALASGMSEWYDHLSTGGGAMLDFLAQKGKIPGLIALEKPQPST